MLKLLVFFGFVFGIIYFFYYKLKRFLYGIFYPEQPENRGKQTKSINKGEMVKCPSCETYFPANTGIKYNGKIYCSEQCLKRYKQ